MIRLSGHAERRSRQRAISTRQIEQILEHADIEKRIGSNCTLIRVSSRAAKSVQPLGSKLSKIGLIWSEANAQLLTVLYLNSSASGARYRSKNRGPL